MCPSPTACRTPALGSERRTGVEHERLQRVQQAARHRPTHGRTGCAGRPTGAEAPKGTAAGGLPSHSSLPHNPPTSDCAAPGEGWAGGPSRRDAQRPSGGRCSRRDSGGGGGGCSLVSPDLVCGREVRRSARGDHSGVSQSAHSPQIVRKTARIGQRQPRATIRKNAGQVGFSVTAHWAKPPLGRFCKAGVRGSIPLVSTPHHRCGAVRPGLRLSSVAPRRPANPEDPT